MSGVEVYFMGGPLDGTTQVVKAWTDGGPHPTFLVDVWKGGDEVPTVFEYRREPSQSDTGPLWVYVPQSDESSTP